MRAEKVAHLAKRYGRVRQHIQHLQAMDRALADAPDGPISLTDPDARAMATSARNSGMVGYNVQTAVDTERHLIVAHDVVNQGHDRDLLVPMTVRRGTVEHPFGTIKAWMGTTHFQTRKLRNVKRRSR